MKSSGSSSSNASLLILLREYFPTYSLDTSINHYCRDLLAKYYTTIVQILLTRLQNSKTDTFALRFVRFYHFVCAKDDKGLGTDFFINVTEQIQSGYVCIQFNWSQPHILF